jgi:putative DNA primase/helicase
MAGKSPRDRPHTFVRDKFHTAFPQTVYSSGSWLRFNGMLWEPVPEFQIKQEIQSIIDRDRQLHLTATSQTLKSILELSRVKGSKPDGQFDAKPDLINMADCTLEISTLQRRPHNHADHLTSAFPFPYDSTARSDVWEFYLDKVVPDDCRWFLQEFAGYCLTTDTLHEIAVWLYGSIGCGKSTFLEGLRAAFGNKVTTFSINNLDQRFGLSHLKGKTLAISTEQPSGVKQIQMLNQLISGESIMIDQKYEDPYELFNRAKFCWAMNEVPKIPSGGIGLERRVVLIKFKDLLERERDDNVKRQVILAGPAIFNWALEGLERLQARGKFERPAPSANVLRLVADAPDVPEWEVK